MERRKHDDSPKQRRRQVIKSSIKAAWSIDYTQISLLPGLRTAIILMLEWFLFGIGNSTSTAFQLTALYVGLSDSISNPSGSLTNRLHSVGCTYVGVLLFGALLPGLVWRVPAALLACSLVLSLVTGLSPAWGPSIFSAMKLSLALFAVNIGVNRSTNGYGGLETFMLWSFYGATASLGAALLPEVIGNRDAVRSELFKVYHGFGASLRHWGPSWGTSAHFQVQPLPTVTVSIYKTKALILTDDTEDAKAKTWLLSFVDNADAVRVGSICLANVHDMMGISSQEHKEGNREIKRFFRAVSRALCHVSYALQFPWLIRYFPFLRSQAEKSIAALNKAADTLISMQQDHPSNVNDLSWIVPIVSLITQDLHSAMERVLEGSTWPRYSSIASLPKRIAAAFPHSWPKPVKDPRLLLTGYALRLAFAFTVAMLPAALFDARVRAHWFPMTVALIMDPHPGNICKAVTNRVLGTLLGLGLGSALTPLFRFPPILTILLGLITYACVLFLPANYAIFTFFITGWIYVVSRMLGEMCL